MRAFDLRRSEAIAGLRAAILVEPPRTQDVKEYCPDAVGHLSRPQRSSAQARRALCSVLIRLTGLHAH